MILMDGKTSLAAINLSRDNRVGCGEGRTASIVMWPDATGGQLSRLKRVASLARSFFLIGLVLLLLALTGCATTADNPHDPWEKWNRGTQKFNDDVDEHLLKPTAEGYAYITPNFISQGVSNFFSNLKDIRVTINDLLQLKFKQGGMDAGRFLVNSTIGLAGLMDVASLIDLPKHNEDFGQTLGYWGVPSGPYLVLPFLGPSSPRGVMGLVGDTAMNPLSYTVLVGGSLSTAASLSATGARALDVVDTREGLLKVEKIATEAALDRYTFFRDAYLQRRRYLIYDGEVPDEYDVDMDIDFDEDLE